MITAVLADPLDMAGHSFFYAADQTGRLVVLGEKGEPIDSVQVKNGGSIFAIQAVQPKRVWVYSEKGRSVVALVNRKLVVEAEKQTKFALDTDAEFHRSLKKGKFRLDEFDTRVPARING